MTTQDADVAVVRRFINEVINEGNIDLAGDFWSEDLTWHGGSLGEVRGLESYKQMLRAASASRRVRAAGRADEHRRVRGPPASDR